MHRTCYSRILHCPYKYTAVAHFSFSDSSNPYFWRRCSIYLLPIVIYSTVSNFCFRHQNVAKHLLLFDYISRSSNTNLRASFTGIPYWRLPDRKLIKLYWCSVFVIVSFRICTLYLRSSTSSTVQSHSNH